MQFSPYGHGLGGGEGGVGFLISHAHARGHTHTPRARTGAMYLQIIARYVLPRIHALKVVTGFYGRRSREVGIFDNVVSIV